MPRAVVVPPDVSVRSVDRISATAGGSKIRLTACVVAACNTASPAASTSILKYLDQQSHLDQFEHVRVCGVTGKALSGGQKRFWVGSHRRVSVYDANEQRQPHQPQVKRTGCIAGVTVGL